MLEQGQSGSCQAVTWYCLAGVAPCHCRVRYLTLLVDQDVPGVAVLDLRNQVRAFPKLLGWTRVSRESTLLLRVWLVWDWSSVLSGRMRAVW